MRHLRRAVLAAVAVAVATSVAPAAAVSASPHGGPVVAPADRVAGFTGGELLRASWAQLLSVPIAQNPFNGHCQPLANGQVPTPIAYGLDPSVPITCTVRRGTSLFPRFGSICTNVEDPTGYGVDEAAQIACARASNRDITAISLSVDGGAAVNIHTRRFEIVSPQGAVRLPADNILGVPPQAATFTAVSWGALVSNLDRGRHTTRLHLGGTDFDVTYTTILSVG